MEVNTQPDSGSLLPPTSLLPGYSCLFNAFKSTLAGAAGGAACVLAGQPFDTVKVKMQTFPEVHAGVVQCLTKTVRMEGFRALYAGSTSSFVSNIGENAVLFLLYGQSREFIRSMSGTQSCEDLSVMQNACAGALSAAFSALVVSPLELIKCRQQAQHELALGKRHSTMASIIGKLVKEEGITGLYRGLTSTWVREIPGYFFFFGGYEMTRRFLSTNRDDKHPLVVVLAGGCGGACFWIGTFPADVVKSRQQVDASGVRSVSFLTGFRTILRNEGVSALYRGLMPTVIRSFPANGALFLAYELTMKYMS
ncbi:mitochondrial ornithine transporter 1-like [Sycon ciliatum]|uniref:mitochondrial ornithine transporter 1-like n=1 Tax=Sycon ciliatum TaxID=27933 RepID=UPI0020ACC7E6|eukprot:scpid65663/ scgid10376/ Mitochondrial ornithine transporter 1; Solute carrier family 25 member 15